LVVEDIKAKTTGKQRWDVSFSPLEVGKRWFYEQLAKLAQVVTRSGWETKQMRDALGLKKTGKKTAEVFEAHCVDAWVLAHSATGGSSQPDNKRMLCVVAFSPPTVAPFATRQTGEENTLWGDAQSRRDAPNPLRG
jgi:hypothetical protein